MLKGWIGRLLPYLLVALIAGAAGRAGSNSLGQTGDTAKACRVPAAGGRAAARKIVYPEGENPGIVRAVAEKNIQAVVSIITVEIRRDEMFNPTEERGVGSGVIVEPNGYILTNDHVVGKNAREINVLFENGQQMPAVVLWQDSALDLALIRVDATGLPYAELGDSDRVSVGDIAVAIGSPLGLRFQRTVTSGDKRAKPVADGRTRRGRGNNGGLDSDRRIHKPGQQRRAAERQGPGIGINSAKASEAEGIGFAVPINIAKPIIKQVVEKGFFRPMYLGIDGYDREIAGYHNSDIDIQKGIYVIRVHNNTPASAAGIREGDIILELDGQPLDSMIKMRSILFGMDRPKKVSVLIKRDGKTITKQVEPAPRPEGY